MFRRDVLEGTELRERMIRGRDWTDLVPDAVVDVIREVDGVKRIRRIAETDANGDEPSDA